MNMRNYARFIPGEEIDAAEPWNFGAVDTASLLLAEQAKVREAEGEAVNTQALQVAHEAIRQEGYADGLAQGHAQAVLETQRQIADYIANQGQEAANNFGQIFATAQAQLSDAEQVTARGTLDLACELARQVLRRELSVDPEVLLPVLREALGLLVTESRAAVVKLNPEDLASFPDGLRADFPGLALTFAADSSLTRGGCLIESAGTVVDGTLEKRWLRAVSNLGLQSAWEVPVGDL
jgi:flagellar assembly protein FliH